MAIIKQHDNPAKKQRRLIALEMSERVNLALAYMKEIELAGGTPSLRRAASIHNVPRSTLHDRWKGRRTRQEAQKSRQVISDEQERVLVEWIKHAAYCGMPMNGGTIRAKAIGIAGVDLGQNWIYRFMRRHPDLKSVYAKKIDAARARQLNPAVVNDFYQKLVAELVENGIPAENIFNADEKGIVCGEEERVKVFVDRKHQSPRKIAQLNRELTTIIECVCANGTAMSPMIIFKGVRMSSLWCPQDDHGLNATYVWFHHN
jgi:Tc5 transposase DNA-binding domain/helix-turn-helix, Psq domain